MRVSDSQSGRFQQEGPAQAGANWYAYCKGDPVNRMDPSGLDDIEVDEGNQVHWLTDSGRRFRIGTFINGEEPLIQYGGPDAAVSYNEVKSRAANIHMDYLGGGGPNHSLESGALLADLDAYLFYQASHGFWDRLLNGSRSLDDFWGGNSPPLIPREGWAATAAGTSTYFLNQALLGVPAYLAGGSTADADLWSPDQRKFHTQVDVALLIEGGRTLPRLMQQLERGNMPGPQLSLADGRGTMTIPGSAAGALGGGDVFGLALFAQSLNVGPSGHHAPAVRKSQGRPFEVGRGDKTRPTIFSRSKDAGADHWKLHDAERAFVGERRGPFLGTDDELFDAYRKAYETLGDMRVDVRSPNGTFFLGENVTPRQAIDLIEAWLRQQGLR